ncbi:hypothetical protein TRFO_38071 [Tritrichomonas foetus]|uniref:MI domain-containing protein n=1 Tax=Tritrichomonas foetus TaxID=1144522 RepID=A0A1J4J9C9_9EUKA|nr:hypothetical protein TRFO_38071 [Tritrichomonas foetus]|eukprot:OHS95794.1 hypothetical protein TRFO_38071 [Tritrichomonas foetus]
MPDFVTPESLEQDDEEIEYYARKLGINDDVDEWDDELRNAGFAKILDGITSAKRSKKKGQKVEMIKAVRTPEEESARKDFTGILNRIAPSNYNIMASRIREAYSTHPPEVSVAMFTRCITQRIFSDAPLPAIFIDVYSKALKEIPDAIQPAVDELQKKSDRINVKPFLKALGEETVNFYSSGNSNKGDTKVDEQVSQLATVARKLHMNTDVRRSVFYAITTAVDIPDAYSKIAKLCLSKTQKKDVPLVILECVKSEATYNPYYSALSKHFIEYEKGFAKNLRVSLRNTMKLMPSFTMPQIRNTAFYVVELIEGGSIDFNVLKGINMMQQPAQGTIFLNILFRELLLKDEAVGFSEQIEKIANMPNFRSDMKKFFEQRLKGFLEKNNKFPKEKMTLLKKSIEVLNRVQ